MSFKFDENLFSAMSSSFRHMLCLAYQSLIAIETNESLSVSGQKNLNSLRFCLFQSSRLFNMADYLMDTDTNSLQKRTETFEIEDILTGIVDAFCQTISAYTPVTSKCSTNLGESACVLLDKSKFELVFLNLLYCCVKKRPNHGKSNLRLFVSVTENKENVVFHIRDNNTNLNQKVVDAAFSPSLPKFKSKNTDSFDYLVEFSLKVAYKCARQMGAKISYTPLKSGNRFDLSIPKAPICQDIRVCSPRAYITDGQLCRQILASLITEEACENLVSIEEELWL